MDTLWQDLRYAVRMLVTKPAFTAVAVLTLALGIGANTAIFSVINAVILKPLDLKNLPELVAIKSQKQQQGGSLGGVSLPDFQEWQQDAKSFQGMFTFTFVALTYTQDAGAIRVDGLEVSPNFFQVLGETPLMGRFFSPGDDRPGNDNILVISELFWRNELGGDPKVIGKTLRVDSKPFTIVGVARAAFSFPESGIGMWKPMPLTNAALADRTGRQYSVVARLKDANALPRANVELQTIAKAIESEHPDTNAGWTTKIVRLQDLTSGSYQDPLFVLLAAVLLVLLIACLNIASLLTARMTGRMKEVGLRLALGASRGRLLRQFLTEGILLSVLGGAAGVLLSVPALRTLLAVLPPGYSGGPPVEIDAHVFLFAIGLSISTGLFFGVIPAWNMNRVQVSSVLKDVSAGTTTGKSRLHLQSVLVVAQVAVSLVLLSGAGLLIRSFVAYRDTDPGFKAQGVLVNTLLVLPADKYTTNEQSVAFFKHLLERVQAFPGVEAAGGITSLPLQFNSSVRGYEIVGRPVSTPGGGRGAVRNVVTENYFKTMGIPLIRGRVFQDSDNTAAPRVALINDQLARQEFKGEDPIGQRLLLHDRDNQPYEIVGVVGSAKQFGLGEEASPEIFTPYQQSHTQFMYIVAKSSGDPMSLAAPIRAAVRELDPDQPVGYRTLEKQFDNAIAGPRFYALLLGVFAALALVLAGVGMYGVLSYLVGQRTREIGIRMALGASRSNVLKQVLGRGLRLAGLGMVIGLLASAGLTRLLKAFLYKVGTGDPLTFAVAMVVLAGVAVLACWIPARRATKVDPIIALRYE